MALLHRLQTALNHDGGRCRVRGMNMKLRLSILLFLVWLSQTSVLCAADPSYIDPADVLKNDGVLLISDGASFYAFKSDGVFYSFPCGMSGRGFHGTWKNTSQIPHTMKFEVTAEMSWMNGSMPLKGNYRRIVFFVYPGGKRPIDKYEFSASGCKWVFQGYFIIDELTKIPDPTPPPSSPR